jgi:pSer/pThr/pTyr-binding forkhead associated (FHA) protein
MSFRIEFFEGPHEGESYPLDPSQGMILGRSPSNGVYLRDRNVSRAHCLMRIEGEECIIEDLGSTNGTFVNGERITETTLKPGDVVRVGVNAFRLARFEEKALTETTTLMDEM